VVSQTFNAADRLTGVADWLGHTSNFGYDADANVTSQAYPNGVNAAYGYDNADQLASITDRTASATLASFAYTRNSLGMVTSATTTGVPGGSQAYTYTALSQLASSNSAPFSYDAAGNMTGLPGGTSQVFNAADELTQGSRPANPVPATVDKVVSANQTSLGTKITSPAMSTKTSGELLLAFISAAGPSSPAQSITAVSGANLHWTLAAQAHSQPGTAEIWQAYAATPVTNAKITATLADTGNDGSITVAAFTGAAPRIGAHAAAGGLSTHPVVSMTTTEPNSLVWAAGEDDTHASTLTPASGQTLVHQYLDSASHATYWAQKTKAIAATSTTVSIGDTIATSDHWNLAAVEIPSATGTITQTNYTYNSRGDRASITPSNGAATTLAYDQADRLISYGGIASYAYNGDDLRMSKAVNGTTTAYTWDTASSVPLLLAAGSTYFIYGPSGQPIEQINGTTVTYLHADQQGSTRMLTNSTGAVVGTYTYSPYGLTTGHTGTTVTALQYDGQYTDGESALIYLRARYYDPANGQFLASDPIEALTQQPYQYAHDNPLNEADFTGLGCGWTSPWDCASSAANAVANTGKTVLHAGLDVVATIPYGIYYVNYQEARGVNWVGDHLGAPGHYISRTVSTVFVPGEAFGLAGDAAIDWIKGHTVNNESICDEGMRGYINPFHQWLPGPLKGPQVYLPGIHPNGDIDFEW
jgi:RHS repeat-associated protein